MSFLPNDYTPPTTSDTGLFMKLSEGENKIRILRPPLLGFIYWGNDDKPYRIRKRIERPYNMRSEGKFGAERVKHFWALLVWDYSTSTVRILEIQQKVIQEQIIELNNDPDWGDPTTYNLKIVKTGQRKDTKYTVIPSPSANIPNNALDSLAETPIDLNAFYFSGKPNDPNWKTDARAKVYERIGTLYSEAPLRGINPEQMDFDNASLSECLTYYENLLEEISKTPVIATGQTPSSVPQSTAIADEVPF